MALERLELGLLDDDELSLRHLPALDELVGRHLDVVLRAPALLLDRGHALAVEQPERDVRLPRGRLRRRSEPDGDAHEPEAQRSVPGDAHRSPKSTGGTVVIRAGRAVPCRIDSEVDGREPHDPPPLARRRRAQHGRGVPRRGRRRLAGGLVGRGGRARRAAGERPARPRRAQGRRVRDPGADVARMGALRLRPRARRRGRALRSTRTPLPRTPGTSSGTRRPWESSARTRSSAAKIEAGRDDAAPPRARAHLRRPPGARGGGPRVPRRAPAGARRRRRGDRRGRPLHVHLHLRDDGAAQGLHDPAPQLLRDGRGRRRDAVRTPSPAT